MIPNAEILPEFNINRISLRETGENQVLPRQQGNLLLLSHRWKLFNETNTNPLCVYLIMWILGLPPGGNVSTRLHKVDSNLWEINRTNIWYSWLSN